jgi:hypothetical protein
MRLRWLGCLLAYVLAITVGANSAMAAPVRSPASGHARGPWCGHSGICLLITASPTSLPHGNIASLEAYATADVGPTPYYIDIVDMTNMVIVGYCGSGTACLAHVTSSVPGSTYNYMAILSITPFKIVNWDSWSNTVAITWT